jgi:allophanate hydrolase
MATDSVFGHGDSLELAKLIPRYRTGELSPKTVLTEVLHRVEQYSDPAVWITRFSSEHIFTQLSAAEKKREAGVDQPLLGIPFAVKDNIDVAGQLTTAACPAFAYIAERSATVVQRLLDAGAIAIGKTNLDQFATGLVGTRSPYGACRNFYDGRYISGGSSSGSAVAVAAGLVSFALGTDTAGSGRVPAAFNNLVGLKPSCGRLSTTGVVPACKSLDCVSIFAHSCAEAATLLRICQGYDPSDPYSRTFELVSGETLASHFRFGTLCNADRVFFGDDEAAAMYESSIRNMEKLGGVAVPVDFSVFTQAAALLYFGPWVAERAIAARGLLQSNPQALHPVTRGILEAGLKLSGIDVFVGMHQLESLRCRAALQWKNMDVLLLPTTGTIYTTEQVLTDPLQTNTNLGRYTNFVNLLNLCAVAVPAGFRSNGVPAGVSLIGPAGIDEQLLALGHLLHQANTSKDFTMPELTTPASARRLQLAVVGAHLSGMPLNHQLTGCGATLVRACKTAPLYRLYALPGTKPPKPGLLRVSPDKGVAVELEVWEMDPEPFASFVAAIPGPLGIGSIQMEDGTSVQGFLCEPYALTEAVDISNFGGWRGYVASKPSA